jgi:tetratricopeptide (TPR) repeat protein
MRYRALLAIAALLSCASALHAQDEADRAWRSGDIAVARRLYAARLAADSTDDQALHRMALMEAWDGHYAVSLHLFDQLLALGPNLDAEVDRARVVAWQGDTRAAIRMLDSLLARTPGYIPALETRAEFFAWAGETGRAVSSYEQLAQILPDDRSVRAARARTLSWASRLDESIALYDSLVRTDRSDREAWLGLGRVLGWAGQTDSAAAVYRSMLARDSTDAAAWAGLAQTQSWAGHLRTAERTWHRAVRADATQVAALVGLAQTLRWEGRNAAAAEVVARAERLAPTNADVRTQRQWVDVALQPHVQTTVTYESDSDGSGILTTFGRGGVRVLPRLDLRPYAYVRWLDFSAGGTTLSRKAWGGALEAWLQIEPGWVVAGALGGSGSDVDSVGAQARWSAWASTPSWWPVIATIATRREPLDATVQLVQNGVAVWQNNLDLRASPAAGWTATGSFSVARFTGSDTNTRTAGALGLSHRIMRPVTVSANARAYGFTKQLRDGYFNPPFYFLAELPVRWEQAFAKWTPGIEVGPGLQKIAHVSLGAAFRVNAELRYAIAPGREIALSGGYSTLGLSLFAEGVGGYRYRTVTLSGAWGF